MTNTQELVYHELREKIRLGDSDADGSGHIFSIMDKMGKASLDLGLLTPKHAGAESPKIADCVAEAVKQSKDGGQLIFCDSVPTHARIMADLVKAGMKPERIGIINADAAASSAARQRITQRFNAGELDVVIGNTATMGEGLNMQKATSDIHHLDLPWEPASLQQRNGRARRQGNKRAGIRIHTYLAKGSFDGYRWQTIQAKRDWQDLLWNGGDRVENLAREGAFSRDDMLVMLSADPEAEREKMAADKEKAIKLRDAADRSSAVATFVKLKEMAHSIAELQKKGSQSQALERLERRVMVMREGLQASKHFSHKHLLDSDAPVLIEPVSNVAYQEGSAFEVTPGDDAPIKLGDAPTRWVVDSIDLDAGHVHARPYGVIGGRAISLKIDTMKSGVTPFTFSKAEEADAIEATMKERRNIQAVGAAKAAMESVNIADYKKIPPEALERIGPELQAQLKQAVMDHRAGHRSHWGMINKQGKPHLVESYDAIHHVDTSDFIMPTPEGQKLATDAYIAARLASKVDTAYEQPRGGRNRYGHGAKAIGMERRYAGKYGHSAMSENPWASVLRDVMGEPALNAAKAALADRVDADIKAAPSMRAAFGAAVPAARTGRHAVHRFAPRVVEALWDKAVEQNALGLQVHSSINAREPGTTPHHFDLFQVGVKNYSTGHESNTVRAYLLALLPPEERAAREAMAHAA